MRGNNPYIQGTNGFFNSPSPKLWQPGSALSGGCGGGGAAIVEGEVVREGLGHLVGQGGGGGGEEQEEEEPGGGGEDHPLCPPLGLAPFGSEHRSRTRMWCSNKNSKTEGNGRLETAGGKLWCGPCTKGAKLFILLNRRHRPQSRRAGEPC